MGILNDSLIQAYESEIRHYERQLQECELDGDYFGAEHCRDVIERRQKQIEELSRVSA